MNYENLAKQVLKNVGGEENVSNLTHCATRLRFNCIVSISIKFFIKSKYRSIKENQWCYGCCR